MPSRTVHGIWPTTLAAIKVWLGGSHTMTVPACASATTAVTEAALGREYVPVVIPGDDHDLEPAVPAVGRRDPVGIEDLHRLCLLAGTWHAAPHLGRWLVMCAGERAWLRG